MSRTAPRIRETGAAVSEHGGTHADGLKSPEQRTAAEAANGEIVYAIGTDAQAKIDNNFTYHAPKPEREQSTRYTEIRVHAKWFAEMLSRQCPPSRELSLAITKLEEVMFWANAAIARNE